MSYFLHRSNHTTLPSLQILVSLQAKRILYGIIIFPSALPLLIKIQLKVAMIWKTILYKVLVDEQSLYRIENEKQYCETFIKVYTPSYITSSEVFINASLGNDPYYKSQQSDKMFPRRVGPFVVKELISKNPNTLNIPDNFEIQPVLNDVNMMRFTKHPTDIGISMQSIPEALLTA